MSSSPSLSATTLVGFLGKNPIERFTPERTRTIWVPDPILDGDRVAKDITVQPRVYLKLSLATHHGQETRWHDCIIWRPDDRTSVQNARLARKGDQVRLSGQFRDYTFTTEEGRPVAGRHFVVESFNFRRMKCQPVD